MEGVRSILEVLLGYEVGMEGVDLRYGSGRPVVW